MILDNKLNYEEENKKLRLFLQKQAERIEKLRQKCNCKEIPNRSCNTGDNKKS
tara:strand:- start:78 stop:236 length:159 start_codon:yes stop_codon:yes gene_type:complete